jgi:transposase
MESRVVGPLPVLRQLIQDIGLVEVIDQLVSWDPQRCRLSPGQRIAALILNILGGQLPLYRVHEFYEDTAVELLFGAETRAEHLTDDALARALDKLAAADPKAVYSAVALRACLQEGIDRRTLHFDTTSRALYGEYADTNDNELRLVHGFSKDHRPDLKQVVIGLLCNRQGIPVWGDVRDGNSSDMIANQDAIAAFCQALDPEQRRQAAYVADSALVTEENLERIAQQGLRFLSRLPERFAVAEEAKAAAWQSGNWEELGQLASEPRPGSARYRAAEQQGVVAGRSYRLLVVHSDHLQARKRKTLERELVREREAIAKAVAALAKVRFSCAADAETAAGSLLQRFEGAMHPITLDVAPVVRRLPYHRRGRPSKDAPVREVQEFAVRGQIGVADPARVEAELRRRGSFVLITNLDAEEFPARRLLEEYRNQTAVEQRFRFLKDPLFVDALYLHTPRRIEALAYVLVMACLVYSVFEHRVRTALAARGEQILLPGKRLSKSPTGTMLLALLKDLTVIRLDGAWRLASPAHMQARAARVAELAGIDLQAAFAHPPP